MVRVQCFVIAVLELIAWVCDTSFFHLRLGHADWVVGFTALLQFFLFCALSLSLSLSYISNWDFPNACIGEF